MIKYRSLLLRSNRYLSSALVERDLINNEQQEAATQKLLEYIQSDQLKQASLLHILLFDHQTLNETVLLNDLVDEYGIGLVNLSNYNVNPINFPEGVDFELCWATWTVPFDQVEGMYFLATAYYLSDPVVTHWEETLGKNVVWFATSAASILESLERINPSIEDTPV